jgi:peptidylprolyl isomerase
VARAPRGGVGFRAFVRRLLPLLALLVALSAVAAGCGSDDEGDSASTPDTASASAPAAAPPTTTEAEPATASKPKVEVPKGPPPQKLVVKDLRKGSGTAAKAGDTVTVQYVGVNYANGKQFDASWDRGQPFQFQLGAGMVIPGWDQGVVGMKPGGRRELTIPPDLAYGAQGAPPDIPPNATLVFVIDLVSIR